MSSRNREMDTRYITLLSVVSCLAVVMMHTNGCFWSFSGTEFYWKTANIIESVCYFAVPVFYMVSGATLLDYSDRYSTKVFFTKRMRKVVLPYVAWSLIGLAFSCFLLKTIDASIVGKRYILNSIADASVVSYYWFFPPLICAYLCMPLFAAVDKEKRKNVFTYLVVAGYFINSVIPFLKNLFSLDLSFPFSISVAGNPLIFILTGYLLSHYDCSQKQKRGIYALSAAALIVHIAGTYLLSMNAGTAVRTFKNPVISVPYAAGIFLFFKTYGNRIMNGIVGKVVQFVKRYTFSIYLLHWFVIKGLNYLYPFNVKSIGYRLGMPFFIIPMCILLTMVLRKLPVIKHIVPQ